MPVHPAIIQPVLEALELAFRQIEIKVPPPMRKSWGNSFVFRYAEQTIQQAIVQKLARMISGLHAIEALLELGLFQEQGVIQRAVDEIEEDIWFLSLAIINNDVTELHTEYLKHFYAEEFMDPSNIVASHASRGMIRREKIRAYNHSKLPSEKDAQRGKTVGKVLTKAYSGYVHAASPHIMDMYGGAPACFDINGTWKSFRYASHAMDAANYFYRAVPAMAVAAKVLGDASLFSELCALETKLRQSSGSEVGDHPSASPLPKS